MTMIGSQMLDILRQGVWASLTGGWYYDPHHLLSTNTVHLYTWLLLFCLPFTLHLVAPPVWWTWAAYSAVIFVVFTVIKTANLVLHHLFDTGEVYEKQKGDNRSGKEIPESFGLHEMTGGERQGTPPVSGDSSELGAGGSRRQQSRRVDSSTFDLKVDVHSLNREEGETCIDINDKENGNQGGEINGDRSDTDVVIMVDESPVGRLHSQHEASRQTELCESYQTGGKTDTGPTGEVSFSSLTTSSQLSGLRNDDNCQPAARRFSNQSNLARSLPSGGRQLCSLELAAILDTPSPGQQRSVGSQQVRRTKSALEPGHLGGVSSDVQSRRDHPVSLDRGIQDTGHMRRGRSVDQQGASEAITELNEEEMVTRPGDVPVTGDMDMDQYQEQLEEATRALLEAGQKLGEVVPGWDETDGAGHTSLLSTVGLDWLFSDSEPDLAPASPKPVGSQQLAGTLRSRSESPRVARSCGQGESEFIDMSGKGVTAREPRDSSHGSSGTDTETRALLNKLEKVESALEESTGGLQGDATDGLEMSAAGARPKRRPSNRRVRHQAGLRSGSLDSGGAREYQMPATNTLYDDAAGLKLFLDILNGPDGENEEAEAELRKLIDRRRSRMGEEGRGQSTVDDEMGGMTLKQKVATRRRRRHNAQSQNDQVTDGSILIPDMGTAEEGKSDARPRRDRRGRGSGDAGTHIATDHADTTSGAVHCFRDEYGNWQTYTFGGETQASNQVGGPPTVASRALASLLNRQQSGGGGSGARVEQQRPPPPDPPQQEPWPSQPTTQEVATPTSTRSSVSADSSLTVILDSPAMVFQPTGERGRSRESSSAATVGGARDGYWSRESSGTGGGAERQLSSRENYWSRENSVLGSTNPRHSTYTGSTTTSATTGPGFRRYNNPIHMFTESFSFLERTRQAANNAGNGDLTFGSTFGGGGGSVQLTRIDESSLAGQLNLTSAGGGHSLDLGSGVSSQLHIGSLGSGPTSGPRSKKYHLLRLPWLSRGQGLKVWLDRLQLINILDHDSAVLTSVSCVLLSVLVSVLGSLVLQTGYYRDLWLVLFCAVLCSCQYSLLKSVQPDASSPTHGFNHTTVFSRPIYFSICCGLVLLLEKVVSDDPSGFKLYGTRHWLNTKDVTIIRDIVYGFILAFPLIFTLGLLPQVNTALMYLLEQTDIHMFGGNAASSLQASVYCVLRSLLAVIVMFGFAYGGLTESSHSAHAQEVLFSIFCALSVCLSYHLSRCSGDPTVVLSVMKRHFLAILSEDTEVDNVPVEVETGSSDNSGVQSPTESDSGGLICSQGDPLPRKLRQTVNARLKNDVIVCLLSAVVVFLIHQSGLFVQAAPTLDLVLWLIAVVLGFLLHYLLPHLRKQTPWKCFNAPLLAPQEQGQFEVRAPAKVMWWETMLLWADTLERSILYPLIFLSAVTQDRPVFESLFGVWCGSLVMVITMMKCLRCVWSDSSRQYFTLLLAILIFQYQPDGRLSHITGHPGDRKSPFLLDFFLTSILSMKLSELYLKCQFVITYIAPHQINWGSAFHAFAQPFSVPHTAMLFLQALISSILSTPLNPLLGSTIFICSYVRPVKFWERNYNTKRTDHSNTRLASQFEVRNPGADDNNLNSIFYEHLTRSLQHSLAGDLMLGRWGTVQQGDCFVLASDYLNCLVHIIELGNGLCTFQVRGLEFRGTYCQQREVEAISEGVEEDEACCCCEPGHLPFMLSVNAAFSQRWLAWEVSAVKYVLEGYSISDNSAQSMLQVWDLRKVLISYYIKSIIYYTVRSPKLMEWLANLSISEAIATTLDKNFVDLDPIFNSNIDEDFDFRSSGITRHSFCSVYLGWIQHCAGARDENMPAGRESQVVSLCFSLSLLGRRALGAASNNSLTSVEFFLTGLHALFKGDFRITCSRDEWVFSDMELLRKVVAPAVRMSLKLHQDHFMSPDEYEESGVLYEAISQHEKTLVISHEGDPAWRHAVLSGAPSLLALRHVFDDGTDEYKIIMLNKRHLSFRVIKLNRECVRGLWAGQQQELIFLRNRNPERGSIQNAKQALRNLINSSCDQPIGYPIYVSPLTTSYSDTNSQVTGVLGGPLSVKVIKSCLLDCWNRLKDHCVAACTSSGSADCDPCGGGGGVPHVGEGGGGQNRGSVVSCVSKPSSGTLVSLAGLLGGPGASISSQMGAPGTNIEMRQMGQGRRARSVSGDSSGTPSLARQRHGSKQGTQAVTMARIIDPYQVYDNINLGRRIDPLWPDNEWRARGGRNNWGTWLAMENMEGPVVHRWTPCHIHPLNRSHTDKTILLIRLGERYVPIPEQAVELLPAPEWTDGDQEGAVGRDKSDKENSEEKVKSKGDKSRSDKSRSDKSKDERLGSKSLLSVDSSKSLAGIPSICERDEEESSLEKEPITEEESAKEVQELRVSTLQQVLSDK